MYDILEGNMLLVFNIATKATVLKDNVSLVGIHMEAQPTPVSKTSKYVNQLHVAHWKHNHNFLWSLDCRFCLCAGHEEEVQLPLKTLSEMSGWR